jgi:hypothetical protein
MEKIRVKPTRRESENNMSDRKHDPFTAAARQRALENHPRGSDVGGAKLNETAVRVMDILATCGWSATEIAEVFDVTFANVCMIIKRKTWKHLARREISQRMLEVLGPDRSLEALLKMTGKNCRIHPRFTNYAISDDGCVFSRLKSAWNPSGQWREMKAPPIINRWYPWVTICHAGERMGRTVHTLVLETFVGPALPGQQCRHLDGSRDNNHLENLRWGSSKENVEDSRRHGVMPIGSTVKTAKLDEAKVVVADFFSAAGWTSKEIANIFCVTDTAVRYALRRTWWKHVPKYEVPALVETCRMIRTLVTQRNVEGLCYLHTRLSKHAEKAS